MTKDKFKMLCEQVLIPRLGNLMHLHLTGVHESLDIIARELARTGDRLDRIAAHLGDRDRHADHR